MLIFSPKRNQFKEERKYPEMSHGRILSILKHFSPSLLGLPFADLFSVSLKPKRIQERLGALVDLGKPALKSEPTS